MHSLGLQHGDLARTSVIASCNPASTGLAPKDEDQQGRKGGVTARNKQRKFKPNLPPVIFGNVQSLDEVHVDIQSSDEYRTCSLLCFTEIWLNETFIDTSRCVEGFTLHRGDRPKESGEFFFFFKQGVE